MKKLKFNFEGLTNFLRIYLKNYFDKDVSTLANNLTYIMILSIFPFFSIIIGVSKGFGIDGILIQRISKLIPESEKTLSYVLQITNNMIDNAREGILTGLGIVVLIYSVLIMLMMLENTFNNIWNVKNTRSYFVRITTYLSIVFLAPLFIILIIVSNSSIVQLLTLYFGDLPLFLGVVIKIINAMLTMSLIMLTFMILPNKKVQFLPAFIGTVITYIGLAVLYKGYMILQSSINNYNVIYGSIAFVPIFLIWVKYVWTIILVGAQTTYTIQTSKEFYEEKYEINTASQKRIGIYLLYILTKRFEKFEEPMTIEDLKEYTGFPKSVIKASLRRLQSLSLVNEVDDKEDSSYYQINKNPYKVTVGMLNELIEGPIDEKILESLSEERLEEYNKIISEVEFKNTKLIKNI